MMVFESIDPAYSIEDVWSYGMINWDPEVWDRLLPELRFCNRNLGLTMKDAVPFVLHFTLKNVFDHLDRALAELDEIEKQTKFLVRRRAEKRDNLTIDYVDRENLMLKYNEIIERARRLRGNAIGVTQASVLLATGGYLKVKE